MAVIYIYIYSMLKGLERELATEHAKFLYFQDERHSTTCKLLTVFP